MQYIYKIENVVNHKVYIGLTNDGQRRKREHFNHKDLKCYIDQQIQAHPDQFTFEVIDECETREEVEQLEVKGIKYYNSFLDGYNKTPGGFLDSAGNCENERNPRAQLTCEDVANIRFRRMQGERMSDVYKDYEHQLKGNKRAGFSKVGLHGSWPNICPEYIGKYPPVDTKYYAAIPKNELTADDYDFLTRYFKGFGPVKYNEIYKVFKQKVDGETFQNQCKNIVAELYGNKSTRRHRNKNGETLRRMNAFREELKEEPKYIA